MRRETAERLFSPVLAVAAPGDRPRAAIRLVWGLDAARPADLELPAPPVAVDVRQLAFSFHKTEVRHGPSSAVA